MNNLAKLLPISLLILVLATGLYIKNRSTISLPGAAVPETLKTPDSHPLQIPLRNIILTQEQITTSPVQTLK